MNSPLVIVLITSFVFCVIVWCFYETKSPPKPPAAWEKIDPLEMDELSPPLYAKNERLWFAEIFKRGDGDFAWFITFRGGHVLGRVHECSSDGHASPEAAMDACDHFVEVLRK